ncbi:MAG: hypothetical protein EOM26_05240 [Alphaproteobacteria bacterium]|nr:hypothetical protein [Alphaproteobacteria bacterium]
MKLPDVTILSQWTYWQCKWLPGLLLKGILYGCIAVIMFPVTVSDPKMGIFLFIFSILAFLNIRYALIRVHQSRAGGASRFERLANLYRNIKLTAFDNLMKLEKGKPEASELRPLAIDQALENLCYEEKGKQLAYIFGEFDSEMRFYPIITEKMLALHSQINFINGVITLQPNTNPYHIIGTIRAVMVKSLFLEHIFRYMARKQKIGKSSKMRNGDAKTKKAVKSMGYGIEMDIHALRQSPITFHGKPEFLPIQSYTWLIYDLSEDTEARTVNDYRLPGEYAKPYLERMAAMQADAM